MARTNCATVSVLVFEVPKKQADLDQIRSAIARSSVIDITTIGRRTGALRRIEIYFHNIDGRIYISGIPREETRAWIRNLEANPRLTFHLKGGTQADLLATARIITEEIERREVLPAVARAWRRDDVEVMVRYSPLIEVTLDALA